MKSAGADGNLLFGVAALHTDAITRTQFNDGCALWASQKKRSLADIFEERGWITAEDRADVTPLVDRKLRRQGGERGLMSTVGLALISLICSFGGALAGVLIRERVPVAHLSQDTAEVVKLGTGLVGTMAALVLGLLVASAATEFNAEATGLQALATNCILLDRALRHYGPESVPARERLRGVVEQAINHATDKGLKRFASAEAVPASGAASAIFEAIRDLDPRTNGQRMVQNQCMQVCADIARARWSLIEGADNPIPTLFLAILMFWLMALFLGFGLLSPRNGTVLAVLFVCALSVAAALFLILDLNEPFDGLIRVSIDPMRDALAELKK